MRIDPSHKYVYVSGNRIGIVLFRSNETKKNTYDYTWTINSKRWVTETCSFNSDWYGVLYKSKMKHCTVEI